MAGVKKQFLINILLTVFVAVLVFAPLLIRRDAEFEGADGKAEKVVSELRPGYEPWYKPLWKPPGSEVESLLFALQAAVGTGFIGYYFGYQRGKKKSRENAQ